MAAALLVALVAWGGVVLAEYQAVDAARSAALQVARTDLRDLATYRYQNLAQDYRLVRAESTPSFWKTFQQSGKGIRSILTNYHADAAAKVLAVGLVSATTHRAVVMGFVDQTMTDTAVTTPTVEPQRVELTLVHQGGRWLVDAANVVA